jgi:hypothetical protein
MQRRDVMLVAGRAVRGALGAQLRHFSMAHGRYGRSATGESLWTWRRALRCGASATDRVSAGQAQSQRQQHRLPVSSPCTCAALVCDVCNIPPGIPQLNALKPRQGMLIPAENRPPSAYQPVCAGVGGKPTTGRDASWCGNRQQHINNACAASKYTLLHNLTCPYPQSTVFLSSCARCRLLLTVIRQARLFRRHLPRSALGPRTTQETSSDTRPIAAGLQC